MLEESLHFSEKQTVEFHDNWLDAEKKLGESQLESESVLAELEKQLADLSADKEMGNAKIALLKDEKSKLSKEIWHLEISLSHMPRPITQEEFQKVFLIWKEIRDDIDGELEPELIRDFEKKLKAFLPKPYSHY